MDTETPKAPEAPKAPETSKAPEAAKTSKAPEAKSKPTDEVTLIDGEGNETTTTRLFYDKQKDSFDLAGLTIKK